MVLNKEERRLTIGIIIFAQLAAAIAVMVVCVEQEPSSMEELKSLLIQAVLMYGLAFIICCVFGFLLFHIIKNLNRDAMKTCFRLLALNFSERVQAKNISFIFPKLQNFLFQVLKENNDFLHLPLGKDAACLSPCGTGTVFRNGCIFYRFQLICSSVLEFSTKELKQLVQQYIKAELLNYGIMGLSSGYLDNKTGSWLTVYLDRIIVDEAAHLITFDLLYVTSHASLEYLQKAVQRDNKQPEPETEVFDDGI